MALLATTLLAACSKVPDGILSEKKMQGVLTDMLLAEAMVNVDYNTYKSDTMKLALYESVFLSGSRSRNRPETFVGFAPSRTVSC